MAGERGSAVAAAGTAVVIMLSMSMLFHCQVAESATHTVQWTYNPVAPSGAKPDDEIVFQYPSGHNVVFFTGNKLSCTPPSNVDTKQSGNDKFILKSGQNNFICSIPGHCDAGMKLAVIAN